MKVRGIALWRVILLVVLVAAIAVGSWLVFDWSRFARTPLSVPVAGQSIDVARGASFKDIVRDLRIEYPPDYTPGHYPGFVWTETKSIRGR